jgi:pyruvate formate lyase activating enzyme
MMNEHMIDKRNQDSQGLVFDIDTFAVHDGPGIRMAVYLKGCPLACAWCHSPESQTRDAELILVRDRCVLCGTCVERCPQGVHAIVEGTHTLAREKCAVCGVCVQHCPAGALSIKGEWMPAARIVERAIHLRPFFKHSGGGVTLTGGEVTLQADFCAAVLAGCRAEGIHTAIETCGACPWERLERLLPQTDLVLYDLKLIDEDAHRRWTGVSNRQILDNARRLAGHNVQIRVPLIPGITDTEGNVRGIFAFMRDVGLARVALLPYNPSAGAKYEWLDRPYAIDGQPQTSRMLDTFLDWGKQQGMDVSIE